MRKLTFRKLAIATTAVLGASLGWSPATLASPANHANSGQVGIRSADSAASCPQVPSDYIAACTVLASPSAARREGSLHPDVPAGYGAADLQSAYGLPPLAERPSQTVAIVNPYEDTTAAADLDEYRSTYGLPACTELVPT